MHSETIRVSALRDRDARKKSERADVSFCRYSIYYNIYIYVHKLFTLGIATILNVQEYLIIKKKSAYLHKIKHEWQRSIRYTDKQV